MAEQANKYFIELLNDVIAAAIDHGGDTGGPYYSNADGLARAMFRLRDWMGLRNEIGVLNDDGGCLQYFLLRHIQEEKGESK